MSGIAIVAFNGVSTGFTLAKTFIGDDLVINSPSIGTQVKSGLPGTQKDA